MRLSGATIELSASDLSQFLSCRHLTALNVSVALGQKSAPHRVDPVLTVLQERGSEHERDYVGSLRKQGLTLVDLSCEDRNDAVRHSLNLMRSGIEIIVQPALRGGRW